MVNAKSEKTFQQEVEELARGNSDSLVDFFYGLIDLSGKFHKPVKVLRADPAVEMIIGTLVKQVTILRYRGQTDRLTLEEVERFADDRDDDNIVNALVYDLLDDAWRLANGQEIEGSIEVTLT